ncbi:transcription factor IIIA-like [Lingula anatina]|uniref:Transcription factor IIIA-like n=1 Tax=Lingula anatina TaxID=7574 RepID=A0A1S3HHB4_LINAN|nr:transcription factor IIIA-like [Lingula anatina]|eukprot:XP_013385470.1 transcription factor IIIA-like [Lingula anatina]
MDIMKRHVKRMHVLQQYVCEYSGCGKSFKKHQHLTVHSYEHTGVKPYKCPFEGCGLSFILPSKLKQHEKVHEGYKCSHAGCDALFAKWSQLRKHLSKDHVKVHTCSTCKKTFTRKEWLRKHEAVHSGERDLFACPYDNCPRSYLDMRNLTHHLKSYHDGKRFPCTQTGCSRTFATKQKLCQHQKLHDSNRQFKKKKVKTDVKRKSMASKLSGISDKDAEEIGANLCDAGERIPEDRTAEMCNTESGSCSGNFTVVTDYTTQVKGTTDHTAKLKGTRDCTAKFMVTTDCSAQVIGTTDSNARMTGTTNCIAQNMGTKDCTTQVTGSENVVTDNFNQIDGNRSSFETVPSSEKDNSMDMLLKNKGDLRNKNVGQSTSNTELLNGYCSNTENNINKVR